MNVAAYVPWNDPVYAPARELLHAVGLIDLHVDSIIQQMLFGYDVRKAHRPGRPGQPRFWHADLPRMREAGYRAACMGIHGWPWESEGVWRGFHRQVDYLDEIAAAEPGVVRVMGARGLAESGDDPRLRLLPGLEGAHVLNGRLERVETLARRGVAYLTITHFNANSAAWPAMGRGANHHKGLTGFGRELVDELNRWGVTVDVAHLNRAGLLEACARSRAPVIASHSGVRALHAHNRLLHDESLEAVVGTGGLMGVIFSPTFLTGRATADATAMADHLDHVVRVAGIEHVAIGTDLDGWLDAIPSDHRDCRDVVKLVHVLMERGWEQGALHALLRGNVERVFRQVADAATLGPQAP